MLRATEGRRAQDFSLQLGDRGYFLSGDEPKQVSFETYGENLEGNFTSLQRANDGSDAIRGLHLAAQRRRDRDIAADLHDIHVEAFIPKEASLLGDVKIDGGDAPAGNRKDDLFMARLRPQRRRRSADKNDRQKEALRKSLPWTAKSRDHQLGDSPISLSSSRTKLKSKISSTATFFFDSTFKRVLSMTFSRVAFDTKRLRL